MGRSRRLLRGGSTVGDVCDALHGGRRGEFRYALVWGRSVRFGGQKVGLAYELMDEDVLTFVTKQ